MRRHLSAPIETRPDPTWPAGIAVRHPGPADAGDLASLMLDAYRGTVDDDGETIDDARAEVDGYLSGGVGAPLLEPSFVALAAGDLVAACLVSLHDGRPLMAYQMTAAHWKRRGLATGLLVAALNALALAGYTHAHLWVTSGNEPAERIYDRLGFAEEAGS